MTDNISSVDNNVKSILQLALGALAGGGSPVAGGVTVEGSRRVSPYIPPL